jgi:hypothetical protein
MTLAVRIEEVLLARAVREATRAAERAALDTFIQAEFPVLNARLRDLLVEVVGVHSRLTVTQVPLVLSVLNRSFTTLPQIVITVAANLEGIPRSVRFEPMLDFRDVSQFGLVQCTTDFDVRLRRSRGAALADSLLTTGIQMRGTTSSHLLINVAGAWVELSASDLEFALAELLLK